MAPPAPALAASFREWFGVTPREAALLTMLYENAGQPVTSKRLGETLGVSAHAVEHYISQLRSALAPEAVDCTRRSGYHLSQIGLDECRAAIAEMAKELEQRA